MAGNVAATRLKEIRIASGYTRKMLSEKLNRPYATITKYENGTREAPAEYLIEVARLFGVTVDYLIGATDKPIPVPSNVSALLGTDSARLTPAELQKLMDSLGNLADFCKRLMATDPSPLPGALECLDAAMECVSKIVSAYERNTAAALIVDLPMNNGTFAGEALRAIDALQSEIARFTLQLQGTIDKMQPPAEE